jgi:hypothetical protein
MNGTRKEHIVGDIKYLGLDAVAEAYREKGVTHDAIYKRHQRGKRGDDLIPEKKREGYIEPVKESEDRFIAGGIAYKNAADACRKLGIKYCTYRSRKNRGFSDEEALEIVPRLDRRKSNAKTYKNIGKEVWVKNKKFLSIAAAARFHGKDIEAVRAKLDKNLSIEQALGLESYLTSRSIVYKGQIYPNKKALAIQIGLKPFQVYEVPKEKNFEQAIDELLCKIVIRGRRNETFYRNNPELGSSKGLIYFSEFNHPSIKPAKEKFFFKVGITQNLKTRNAKLKYIGKSWFQETTQLDASRAEAEIIDLYNDKLTDKISSKEVDGKGEIFEITKDQAVEVEISICKYLLYLDQPEKVEQPLSKGNLDN